jgi:hypothetical protein
MPFARGQRGAVTLIGALFIVLVIGLMVQIINRMASSDITDTAAHNDAVDALFVAESGIEFASFSYANGTTACADLKLIGTTPAGRGNFDVTDSYLVGTDCRIIVQGSVSSTGAISPDAALRTISADLRLNTGGVVAVGNNGTILRWNGSSWSQETSGTTQDLRSVYCPGSNECWAVGGNRTILHWTGGSSWTTSFVSNDGSFTGVSCEPNNPSNCYAVGVDIAFKGLSNTATMHWDGSSWTDSGGAYPFNYYEAVSCPNAGCFAVANSGDAFTSATGWNSDSLNAGLPQHGIDCFSGIDCWSVGDRPSNNTLRFFRRNGGGWSSSDLNSNETSDLRSVSCANSANCKAVGDFRGGRFTVVSWNGSSWSVESFNDNNRENLNGVHCAAADNCWAVGNFRNGRSTGNSLHWDGSTWTYVGTPALEDLNGVFVIDPGSGGGSVSLVRWQELINN